MTGRHLAREVAAVCAIKLIAIAALYGLFFSPSHRPAVDLAARLAAPSSSSLSDSR